MKVFLDTNVIVSAFAAGGLCAELFRAVVEDHALLTSDQVLSELQRVLPRQFDATSSEVQEVLSILREFHVEKTPAPPYDIVVRDPDDIAIVAAAIAAGAEVLVTGDQDLLDLTVKLPLKIITPRQFFEML